MRYNYEALDGVRFQKLAQDLIVKSYPETQCLPAPQPDGGRDALLYFDLAAKSEFIVFQIKFSTNPRDKDAREAIVNVIESEREKVAKLVEKGATKYVLITNVSGTAIPDAGSIDKANEELGAAFDIPSSIWWRDDLDRRLDGYVDIRWAFPEILSATDLLPLLIEPNSDNQKLKPATDAFTGYMGKQFGADRDVKFKQVELNRRLTELFVDLPIGLKRRAEPGHETEDTDQVDALTAYLSELDRFQDEPFDLEDAEPDRRAASFLLQLPYLSGVSRIVLEGGPGHGKSTVTQYLCQVNRLKLLPTHRNQLKDIPNHHRAASARSPFRVDLRDFAAWVSEPPSCNASASSEVGLPTRSLEQFLTQHIQTQSGGLAFAVNDLLAFLKSAPCLIVLDGFDEVADIETRQRLVTEICNAADRFDAHALSVQIIVTSRPNAFANSPGFPEDDWHHIELTSLQREDIHNYQTKWSKAQRQTEAEIADLAAILEAKLEQSHLGDLARNPMQLAILLHLIMVQGEALPDKRTSLYDEYMKVFLNREVEKKMIKGNDRQLILSLHGLLAWKLQEQSELGKGAGSFTEIQLRQIIQSYLNEEGFNNMDSEVLLKGTTERVGALVSRVQGSYEFEVQPMREYFAAKHLKETIKYVSVYEEAKGSLPDRFAALARNRYWTNVTRFFCGLCNRGELSALVDGLLELDSEEPYSLINQQRSLAIMLMSDHVFTDAPNVLSRLADFIALGPSLERLMASERFSGRGVFSLPEEAGGQKLAEAASARLDEDADPETISSLLELVSAGIPEEARKTLWLERYRTDRLETRHLWAVHRLNLLFSFTSEEISALDKISLNERVSWLLQKGELDYLVKNEEMRECLKSRFAEGRRFPEQLRYNVPINVPINVPTRTAASFLVLTNLLDARRLRDMFRSSNQSSRRFSSRVSRRVSELNRYYNGEENLASYDGELDEFCSYFLRMLSDDSIDWHNSLDPWCALVDRGLGVFGESLLVQSIAFVAVAQTVRASRRIRSNPLLEESAELLHGADLETINGEELSCFSTKPGLVKRLYFAKSRSSDFDWWSGQIAVTEGPDQVLLFASLLGWGSPLVLKQSVPAFAKFLEGLDQKSWDMMLRMLPVVFDFGLLRHRRSSVFAFSDIDPKSPRLIYLFGRRFEFGPESDEERRCYFADYAGADPRILDLALESELRTSQGIRPPEETNWERVKQISVLAKAEGLSLFPLNRNLSDSIEVPYEVAKDVLRNVSQHEHQFVAWSERAVSDYTSRQLPTVSETADKQAWFNPQAT